MNKIKLFTLKFMVDICLKFSCTNIILKYSVKDNLMMTEITFSGAYAPS